MKALRITTVFLLLSGTVAWVGCKPTAKYEVDFNCHRLHWIPTGQVETNSDESSFHRVAGDEQGDGPPGQSKGAGQFVLRVENVTSTNAVFRVTFADGTQTNLTLVPKVPKEQFESRGSNGINIVVDDIRIRSEVR